MSSNSCPHLDKLNPMHSDAVSCINDATSATEMHVMHSEFKVLCTLRKRMQA
jgi:hypothetical protein